MRWHVVVRKGLDDSYQPALAHGEPRAEVCIDRPGSLGLAENNISELLNNCGYVLTASMQDLVVLALSVYSADLRIPRDHASDRWHREFSVHLPVSDVDTFSTVQPDIERMLNYLTGDNWTFLARTSTHVNHPKKGNSKSPAPSDMVCLFSGGLDSLVGALDLAATRSRIALVGHHGSGITNTIQQSLLKSIEERYEGRVTSFMFHVQPSKNKIKKGEPSMRSRSLLFFVLGTLVAHVNNNCPLVIAENGLISLNIPLTPSRMGSLSTRTTHPFFVDQYQHLIKAMGITVELKTPYQFKTKGEMLVESKEFDFLQRLVSITMSCSHPEAGRWGRRSVKKHEHCGYCVPCIIRRAAIKLAGWDSSDGYSVNVLTHAPSPTSGSGRDLRAVQIALERISGYSEARLLFQVLQSGQLPALNVGAYIDVYRRGMEEVREFLSSSQ